LDYDACRRFSRLSKQDRITFAEQLSEDEAKELRYLWPAWARDNQLPPKGSWAIWLILAGRGMGKTRMGAEFVRWKVETGQWGRMALIGRTAADVRDVMIDGESGLLAVSHPDFMPKHESSRRRLVWPNGATATTFSAEEPDSLRGPQNEGAWFDEGAAARYAQPAFDNLMFGLRLGSNPQVVMTTTPKPIPFIKDLVKQPNVHVTTGTTYENLENLAPTFRDQIIAKYAGTTLGAQELLGQLIGEVEGALWTRARLELTRIDPRLIPLPKWVRIVVGVDPAVTNEPGSDETGIVVVALGDDGHFYVLGDYTLKASPKTWAEKVVAVYYLVGADRIACESNQGGDLLETVIRSVEGGTYVAYRKKHAAEGKKARAEPVAAIYEQGRAHHVGFFAELEDEQCNWVQGAKSPNRLDALVWAIAELVTGSGTIPIVTTASLRRPMAGATALTQATYEGQMLAAQTVQHVEQREQPVSQRERDDATRQGQLSRLLGDLSRIRGGR
jgi:phage terminase large subunit-like protein